MMKTHAISLSYALLVVSVATLALGRWNPAQGAQMSHHDLASLFFLADLIVVAEAGPQHEGTPPTRTFHVRQVLKGEGPRDATLQVIDLAPAWRLDTPAPEQAVLFLRPPHPDHAGIRVPVSGGMLLVDGDQSYRLVQENNPGPYVAVALGHDPDDVLGWERPERGLPPRELEAALTAAASRATAASQALALEEGPAQRQALLALLPPRRTFPPPMRHLVPGTYRNALAEALIAAIAASDDHAAFVDAMGRDLAYPLRHRHLSSLRATLVGARLDFLRATALDPSQPTSSRAAAVSTMALTACDVIEDTDLDTLAELAARHETWVAVAAVTTLEALSKCDQHRSDARKRLAEAAAENADGHVRVAIAQGLSNIDARRKSSSDGDPWAALFASLPRGERLPMLVMQPGPRQALPATTLDFGFRYALPSGHPQQMRQIVALAHLSDGTTQRSEPGRYHWHGRGRGLAAFDFHPPIAATVRGFSAEATFEGKGHEARQLTSPWP